MLIIAAIISFLISWIPELQIIGLLSAKRLVRSLDKFGILYNDSVDSESAAIFKLAVNDYFKKYHLSLFFNSFIIIAIIAAGFFLGKNIFWGCIIGVVASIIRALSKETDLRDEFLNEIGKRIEAIENNRNKNIITVNSSKQAHESTFHNNYCRKCGALLSEDSVFCKRCGEKIIIEEECENALSKM